jgi:hypothetical protein
MDEPSIQGFLVCDPQIVTKTDPAKFAELRFQLVDNSAPQSPRRSGKFVHLVAALGLSGKYNSLF